MKTDAEPKPKLIKAVSVFGFADAKESEKLYREAYEVGRVLAQAGLVVVNGGGPGVMEAASRGAKSVSGKVIGVTFYPVETTTFEGRAWSNPIDEEVVCGNYLERTMKLLGLGDAYIILNGGTGTISEFGMAWGLARLYFGHHKPLILYGEFWRKILAEIRKYMPIRSEEVKVYKVCGNTDELIFAIEQFEKELLQAVHRHQQTAEKTFRI